MSLQIVSNKFGDISTPMIITILIGLYAALIKPPLPKYIVNLFSNTLFRIGICFLIIERANKDIRMALMIAVAFIITLSIVIGMETKNTINTIEKMEFNSAIDNITNNINQINKYINSSNVKSNPYDVFDIINKYNSIIYLIYNEISPEQRRTDGQINTIMALKNPVSGPTVAVLKRASPSPLIKKQASPSPSPTIPTITYLDDYKNDIINKCINNINIIISGVSKPSPTGKITALTINKYNYLNNYLNNTNNDTNEIKNIIDVDIPNLTEDNIKNATLGESFIIFNYVVDYNITTPNYNLLKERIKTLTTTTLPKIRQHYFNLNRELTSDNLIDSLYQNRLFELNQHLISFYAEIKQEIPVIYGISGEETQIQNNFHIINIYINGISSWSKIRITKLFNTTIQLISKQINSVKGELKQQTSAQSKLVNKMMFYKKELDKYKTVLNIQ